MKKTLIAVFTIFVMIVAACGGSDSGSDNESSQSSVEEAPSSSGTSDDSSPAGEDSDGNDARDTLIGIISAVTGLENEDYVACIVDSVAESEGLTYEEILQDITNEESKTDEAAEAASIACIAELSPEEIMELSEIGEEGSDVDEPVEADYSLPAVRIGLMNQENDPIGSFPEIRFGIEGAVNYINAELGGIDGHPVELVTCLQNSVPAAQECAQELATSDLVSVINGVNIWTVAFDFYGTMGNTPVIGGLPLFALSLIHI